MRPSLSTGLAAIMSLSLALLPSTSALPQPQTDIITDIITDTTSSTNSTGAACNNSPSLCSQAYNNITHMGAHDSSFVREGANLNNVAGNQYLNATEALDAGLRLLQVQVHVESGQLRMCHTFCSLYDAGLLSDWLAKIRVWMDANTNEVVTLIIVNSDSASAADFGAQFEAAGIAKYGYSQTASGATSTWPTLQEMIDANTRLVTFVASVTVDSAYPYLLSEFAWMFETAFEVTTVGGFNCTLDRPGRLNTATEAIQANYLGMINHMRQDAITSSITIPAVDEIATTNSADTNTQSALGLHVQQCIKEWGMRPQFVLVDFWNEGDVMAVADSANGLSSTSVTGRKQPSTVSADGAADRTGVGMGALMIAVAAAVVLF